MIASTESASSETAMDETIRCFVGIAAEDMGLEAVLASGIARWHRHEALHAIRWTPPEFLHLTLAFLGAQPRARLLPLVTSLTEALEDVPVFPLALTHCRGFPDATSPVVAALPAPSPALLALQQRVVNTVMAVGMGGGDARPYLPHITLGRWGRHAHVPVFDEPLLATGCVRAVSLYRSETRERGSHYTVMARFPLRAPVSGIAQGDTN